MRHPYTIQQALSDYIYHGIPCVVDGDDRIVRIYDDEAEIDEPLGTYICDYTWDGRFVC